MHGCLIIRNQIIRQTVNEWTIFKLMPCIMHTVLKGVLSKTKVRVQQITKFTIQIVSGLEAWFGPFFRSVIKEKTGQNNRFKANSENMKRRHGVAVLMAHLLHSETAPVQVL